MILYEKLDARRKEKGVTWSYLETIVSGYRGKFVDFKKGKTTLNAVDENALAKALDTTIEYLSGKSNDHSDTTSLSFDKQLEGVDFAFFGEVSELDDDDKADVLEFIRYKKMLKAKKGQENKK